MVSDHAEKLLDVWDVLHGQTSIFFPRNTGREAIQMYLTAGIIQLFHTGYTFLSLKIGTVLAGLLTLPYIYLLGQGAGQPPGGFVSHAVCRHWLLAERHLARGAALPALSAVRRPGAVLPDAGLAHLQPQRFYPVRSGAGDWPARLYPHPHPAARHPGGGGLVFAAPQSPGASVCRSYPDCWCWCWSR